MRATISDLIERVLSLLVALAIPQTSEPARPGPPQFIHP
jgi:hypothetical protein